MENMHYNYGYNQPVSPGDPELEKISQKNWLDVQKQAAIENIKSQGQAEREWQKMCSREARKENELAQHEEVIVDANGNIYCITRNLNIRAEKRETFNFKVLNPIKVVSSDGDTGVWIFKFIVDGVERSCVMAEKYIFDVKYVTRKLGCCGCRIYATSPRSRCLEEQKGNSAEGVRSRLWGILNGNLLRPSTKQIESGKINIISLAGINPKTQIQLTEIILSVVWRQLRYRQFSKVDVVCIDEIQSLSLKKNSALFELLTESRKYGISLVLATQSLSVFDKKEIAALGQTAVKLYFHPSEQDIRSIAQQIDPVAYERVAMVLKNLRKGQALTVGDIEKAGHKIGGPIVTMSQFGKEEHSKFAISNNTEGR